jgi:hypothetical protein
MKKIVRRQGSAADESASSGGGNDWGERIGPSGIALPPIPSFTNFGMDEAYEDTPRSTGKRGRGKGGRVKAVSFADIIREHQTQNVESDFLYVPESEEDAHGCRACELGYFIDEDNKLADAIANLIKKCAHHIHLKTLVEEVYQLGELERQSKIEAGEDDPGEWTREGVAKHLFWCMTDMSLWQAKELNDLKHLSAILKDQLYEKTEDGEIMINEKAWKLLMQVQTQMKTLWTIASEKAVSFNSKITLPSARHRQFS